MPIPLIAKAVAGAAKLVGGKKALGAAAKRVLPQLAGSLLSGRGRAGRLSDFQQAALMEAMDFNRRVANLRLNRANELYNEAGLFDPEHMGRQAAKAAMTRGAIQTAQQTRGLTGSRLAAERRRMQLGTARTAGTAFQQGFNTGVTSRLQTRMAGLQAMPTQFPSAVAEGYAAQQGAAAAENVRQGRAAGIGSLIGSVFGADTEATGIPRGPDAGLLPSVNETIEQNPGLF